MSPNHASIRTLILIPALATLALAAPGGGQGGGKGNGNGGGGGGGGGPSSPAILYAQMDANETHIMVADSDGGNPTLVLANALQKFSIQTALDTSMSPDGSTLVFWSNILGSDLFTIHLDGTGLQAIGPTDSSVSGLEWSPVPLPDGTSRIAFSDGVGSLDVHLIQPDGSGCFNLTNTPNLSESFPTWSPDATRLAVIGNGGTPYRRDLLVYDIALVNGLPAVTGVTNLTNFPGSPLVDNYSLLWGSWSHDGSRIAVTVRLPGDEYSDLWVVDPSDPAAAVNITGTPTLNELVPSWSPDDLELVYFRNRGKKSTEGLNVIRLDGSGTRSLGVQKGFHPDWFAN